MENSFKITRLICAKAALDLNEGRWKFLIKYFVTDRELEHLRKVAGDIPSSYDYDDYQKGIFATELRRLRSFDLIQMQPNAYIADLPKKGDLKDYCKITQRGEMYLKLRQEVDSQS